jgi:hypothetical protein
MANPDSGTDNGYEWCLTPTHSTETAI